MNRPLIPSRLSPCTGICTIDPASGLCAGCGRTGAEISLWASLTDDARRAIMDGLAERMERAGLDPARSRASR